MIILATLTNEENCCFDSTSFEAKTAHNAVAAAKRWAAGRGGEYGLSVAILDGHGEDYAKSIGDFYYSGKCRRAVAL